MDFIMNNIRKILMVIVLIIVALYVTGCSGMSQAFKEGYIEGHNATAPAESRIETSDDLNKSEEQDSEGNPSEAQGEDQ